MKFYFKKNLSKIVIFILLSVGLFFTFNSILNSMSISNKNTKQSEIYIAKLNELTNENKRIIELYQVTDGVSDNDYYTYEDRELKDLDKWQKKNHMTNEQYRYLRELVKDNADVYEDVYFNQPTRNNY